MRRWLKRLAKFAMRGLIALALLTAAGWAYVAHLDAEHARFFQTGRSINTFLKEYGHALQASFAAHDPGPVAAFYSAAYASPGRGRWALVPDRTESCVAVSRLRADGRQTYGPADVRGELAAYLAGLTAVDDVKVKIDLIEHAEPDRRATLTVKFILDGRDRAGAYFQDRFFYRWHLENEAPAGAECGWRIVRDELVEGVRVAGARDGFRAVPPASAGVDYVHARDPHLDPEKCELKFGVVEHAFGGVSVADYDGDGRPDVFFPDGVRSRLFKNVTERPGEPRFVDVTDQAGLGGIDRANCALFVDLDNDGHKDLMVVRYCAPSLVFRNNGDGTFTDCTREMGFDLDAPALAACALDYDRDGFVDVYVGVYGNAFTDIPRMPFLARNGGKNRLYRNVGGKRFEDVTDSAGVGDTGWTMATAAGDLHGSGYPDIVLANDFGKKTVYRNNGDGTFTETTKQAGTLDFSGGMGVALADFDDDSHLDIYFSNINSNQRWFGEDLTVKQYVRNVARTRWLWKDLSEYRAVYDLVGADWRELGKRTGKGNTLYRNRGDGTFEELAGSHTTRAGWGFGVAAFDMDNDTDLDVFAANGWITNVCKDDL